MAILIGRTAVSGSMVQSALWLVLGLGLIVKGGDWFVSAAVRLAGFLRMPRVVIGSTLVSLATTTPELVVSVMAGLSGQSGLAVGNAVGSCICNIALILGVTAGFKALVIHIRVLRFSLAVMFGSAILLFLMTLDLVLSRWQGMVLVSLGLAYFAFDFFQHYRDRKPQDLAEATAINLEKARTAWDWLQTPWGTVVQFAIAGVIVVLGSRWLVGGAVEIASKLGIPAIIIGLSIVAVGTSLPELVTAITSCRQEVSDLSVGNVLGANIANLTLIVGVAAIIADVRMDRPTQLFNFPAMLAIMLVLLWMMLDDRRITRREGAVLISCYAAYLLALLVLTLWAH